MVLAHSGLAEETRGVAVLGHRGMREGHDDKHNDTAAEGGAQHETIRGV
jgi:hypothetical protein